MVGKELQQVWNYLKRRSVELLGLVGMILIAVDFYLYSGSVFVSQTITYAGENQGALSVIFTGLLFYGYILQYRTSDRQREIMENQTDLMDAGYTPIVGIKDRSFKDGGDEIDLILANKGNSLARDLRVETVIAYETPQRADGNHRVEVSHYKTNTTPIERGGTTKWWKPDSGVMIGEGEGIEDDLYFSANLKVGSAAIEEDDEFLSKALDSLYEDGVDTVQIALVLKFRNAKMDESELPFYTTECNLDRLSNSNMNISRGMESEADDLREIRIHSRT